MCTGTRYGTIPYANYQVPNTGWELRFRTLGAFREDKSRLQRLRPPSTKIGQTGQGTKNTWLGPSRRCRGRQTCTGASEDGQASKPCHSNSVPFISAPLNYISFRVISSHYLTYNSIPSRPVQLRQAQFHPIPSRSISSSISCHSVPLSSSRLTTPHSI